MLPRWNFHTDRTPQFQIFIASKERTSIQRAASLTLGSFQTFAARCAEARCADKADANELFLIREKSRCSVPASGGSDLR